MGVAIKPKCQPLSTRVPSTFSTHKLVPQPLTVLLSYSIEAYVPLFAAPVKRKMTIVHSELN
jgi:hypothetical protein